VWVAVLVLVLLPLPLPSLAAAYARPPATTTRPTPAGVLRPPVAPAAELPLVPAAVLSWAKLMPEASSRPLANRAIVCFFISRLLKMGFLGLYPVHSSWEPYVTHWFSYLMINGRAHRPICTRTGNKHSCHSHRRRPFSAPR